MEANLGLLGGGGDSGNESDSTVVEQDYMGVSSEGSSYPGGGGGAELELGLGLSLGSSGGAKTPAAAVVRGEHRRFLTAKDLPSAVPSHGSSSPALCRFAGASAAVSGTKRAADNSVGQEVASPPGISQVVGWPPLRACRKNSLVSQTRALNAEEDKTEKYKIKDNSKNKVYNGGNKNNTSTVKERRQVGFVKVNMDGLPIGRKVDLNAHGRYETLAQALEDMFFRPNNNPGEEKEKARKPSRLLNGSSEFVLTYEDKEGDWMLVGDVPWEMFLNTVRRLRIMKTSEANGLAPRFEGTGERQINKRI